MAEVPKKKTRITKRAQQAKTAAKPERVFGLPNAISVSQSSNNALFTFDFTSPNPTGSTFNNNTFITIPDAKPSRSRKSKTLAASVRESNYDDSDNVYAKPGTSFSHLVIGAENADEARITSNEIIDVENQRDNDAQIVIHRHAPPNITSETDAAISSTLDSFFKENLLESSPAQDWAVSELSSEEQTAPLAAVSNKKPVPKVAAHEFFIKKVSFDYSKRNAGVLRCWWCSHSFDGLPFPLPTHYSTQNREFKVMGFFCSPNCALAFNEKINKKFDSDLVRFFILALHDPDGKDIAAQIRDIRAAPSWRVLREYGGSFSIDEFRQNFFSVDKIEIFDMPMISYMTTIEKMYFPDVETMAANSPDSAAGIVRSDKSARAPAKKKFKLQREAPLQAKVKDIF